MGDLIGTLRDHATNRPRAPALRGDDISLDYGELAKEIDRFAGEIPGRRLGLLLDNGPAWIVADLAAFSAGITCVPLPPFFTDAQMEHTLRDAGIDCILTDQPERLERIAACTSFSAVMVAGWAFFMVAVRMHGPAFEPGQIAKITYASGSTGVPRGVCLSRQVLEHKAEALAQLTAAATHDISLCLTPLAILLENIGGAYVPLLAGATCCAPSLQTVGMTGSSGLDVARMMRALHACRPTSVITTPQLLRAMVAALGQGASPPDSLRFVAVGGAPVARDLLARAAQYGLPVYQGYGLSEAGSVVALNTPGHNRPGSVGRVLPGITVSIALDGEIMLDGELFDGYLGQERRAAREFATGDLGHIDSDGYLYVAGRKKNAYATAYGRNVSPEWVESELCAHPAVAQAVVFGEASPVNVAIILPMRDARPEDVRKAVDAANRKLPDYARVREFLLAEEAFTVTNGQLTGTGRPRREAIERRYRDALLALMREAV